MRFRWLLFVCTALAAAVACTGSGSGPTSSPTDAATTPTSVSAATTVKTSQPTPTPAPVSEWMPVAPMNVGRTSYSATLLNDGRVLVVGGLGAEGVLHSAEIYDPEADSWTVAADAIHSRRNAILATLADGRVVAAGGLDNVTVSTAEMFDPERNQWTELPPLNVGRESAMAVSLDDGRLLVFGGGNGVIGGETGSFELHSAEIYDPELNQWVVIDPIAQAEMSWEGWVKLNDGRVLLVGGDFARPNRFVQLFDPSDDSWHRLTELPEQTGGGAATLLPDGNVLVAGGGLRCCLTDTLVFDIESEEWMQGPEMLVERGGHIGLNRPDGRIMFLFGLNPDLPFDEPYRGGEIFDPESGTWELLPDFPGVFNVVNQVVMLQDGQILMAGGRVATVDENQLVEINYSTDVFLLRIPDR